ncbi:MAG TPA: hypothetical protein VLW75_04795 [Rhizomicrobium sp.]|nr:hypothetical protein [Rhizomicrobium sp.]
MKFASITADLLARKGEAAPAPQSAPVAEPRREKRAPRAADDPKTNDPERARRLFVPMSADQHERLRLAAVKKNASAHDIVHAALEHYFQKLAADAQCQCIAGVCTRGCAAH